MWDLKQHECFKERSEWQDIVKYLSSLCWHFSMSTEWKKLDIGGKRKGKEKGKRKGAGRWCGLARPRGEESRRSPLGSGWEGWAGSCKSNWKVGTEVAGEGRGRNGIKLGVLGALRFEYSWSGVQQSSLWKMFEEQMSSGSVTMPRETRHLSLSSS